MDNKLYCGASKVKITPSDELLPYMFGLMGQQYGRVHDDIYLRVLALKSGESRALVVVYDLDKATNPEEWVKKLSERTGIPEENILYLAIHTHTAPLTGYRPFEGPNFIERKPPEVQVKVREYESFLLEKLLSAADEALGKLVPVRMGYSTGECHIGINRCQQYNVLGENGEVFPSMGIGIDPSGISDPTLLVVRFDSVETGEPVAFMTNYAVHCVATFLNTCDDGKAFLSGDIGGNVSGAIEGKYPGSVALWTSAPAGDINPSQMIQNFYPDPVTGASVQRCIIGEDAADTILAVMVNRQLDSIKETLRSVTCDCGEAAIKGSISWARTKYAKGGFTSENPEFDSDYNIRLHLLQIGPLALIGVDGELYTSLGQAIKAVSPVADTFVINHDCSLLLGNPGYIMDDEMMEKLKLCAGRGSQGGGVPGGGIYTEPGSVKRAIESAALALFE